MQQTMYIRPTYNSEVGLHDANHSHAVPGSRLLRRPSLFTCMAYAEAAMLLCTSVAIADAVACHAPSVTMCMLSLTHMPNCCSSCLHTKCCGVLQFPELGGAMANHNMQGPFSPGSAPHSPAGPPGLMMAGPMPHPEYMHPHAMGAGGQYIPVPMQVPLFPSPCNTWDAHVLRCIHGLQLAKPHSACGAWRKLQL